MEDNKITNSEFKLIKSVKLVDTKITGYTVLHDKRIAYIKEDSTIEIRDPKQDNKVVASSKPYSNFSEGEWDRSIFRELSNGNLITNFYTDEFVVFTIDKDSIYQVGVIKNIKARLLESEFLPLSKNRFAVIDGKVVYICKGDVPLQNEPLKKIDFDSWIYSILQLKGKEILVVRFEAKIVFINLENYSIVDSFECNKIECGKHLFQYDDDRLIDHTYLVNIKTKSSVNLMNDDTYSFNRLIKLRDGKLLVQGEQKYNNGYSWESSPYMFVIDVNSMKFKKIDDYKQGHMDVINEHIFVRLDELDSHAINKIEYYSY